MFDPSPYVGIPFSADNSSGVNCWELVRKVYEGERGILLPEYPDVEGRGEADRLSKCAPWTAAGRPLRPFDILVFRVAGAPVHVGVLVSGREFLHAMAPVGSAVERLSGGLWPNRLEYAIRLTPHALNALRATTAV